MRLFYSLFFVVILLGTVSCSSKKIVKNNRQISVSILPQKYFVDRIAGNDFKVNVLIPPGGSPETYEPTPIQMQEVAQSIAYLKIGNLPFENTWMQHLIEGAHQIKVFNLSENINLIKGGHVKHGDHIHDEGVDPHVWTSPKSAIQMAKNLYDDLIELAPNKKDIYKARLDQFLEELNQLDRDAQKILGTSNQKSFMIFHPALSYLARDYGLNQIAIEMEGKEPSPAHMKYLVNEAREHQIKVVFIQKQFNKENAYTIANEIGAEVVQIDPLNQDWLSEMRNIINHLNKDAKENLKP